ncbi:GGDEF domain-containing protein [Candidatus Methylospira mobilis]|nr:GGDEF domain-containing protein [Candidatus Methylospira mobilis]
MLGLLSCLLAGMLLLTGWHLKSIRGIREYALGDLCIGLTFCVGGYYSPLAADDECMVLEAMVLTFGQSLRINGIRAFNGEKPNLLLPFVIMILVGINTYWWVVVHTDASLRAMTNSVFFCLINLLCIRALSIRTETLVRMAYRLTGGAYAFLVLLIALRAIATLRTDSPADHYYVNHGFLLLASVAQFCAAFGFMLMLNYRLAAALEHAASCDSLTGALNRRSLALIADRLCLQLTKLQQPLALIMLDVDHFKSINDRFGHPQGDDVLRRLAELARASIRNTDYLGRYGGEEFCVLLPNATESEALQIAERMRNSIANTPLPTETGDTITCTISIGICDSEHFGLDFETMVNQADKALYYAKQNGRNRALTVAQLNEVAVAA